MQNNRYIAALDIGSNSFHLVIAKILDDNKFEICRREREVLRLSVQEEGKSIIPQDNYQKAAELLNRFKIISNSFNTPIKAVATSAVREADNQNDFINYIENETGVKIEVINGKREAEMIYKAISLTLQIKDKKLLCIDIGGGSTELIIGVNGKTLYSTSVKLGAVRLSQMFFPDYILSKERIIRCEQHVRKLLLSVINDINTTGFELCAGSSGSFRTVISLIKKNEYNFNCNYTGIEFTKHQLNEIMQVILLNSTTEERMKIPGMEIKRADIIPAGIIILKVLFEVLKIEKVVYSDYSLREGIIIDLLDRMKSESL